MKKKNLVHLIFLVIASVFFVACGDKSNEYDEIIDLAYADLAKISNEDTQYGTREESNTYVSIAEEYKHEGVILRLNVPVTNKKIQEVKVIEYWYLYEFGSEKLEYISTINSNMDLKKLKSLELIYKETNLNPKS
ncbi:MULTISPECIES: hypothetical protein [unclassified Enterococcus]|uniref:hypothetical protein n=1 Tax=unclassified Enterococcus TaxID=2608891 RepID=UPI00190856C8|nr:MULTISPECIES: hypothetical protein [unclassified Enterococcus]MBK0036054.1 hypothetical protein [Enterococcus sp. S52]MBK0068712.1 hypothetical protein [Enterococcus sp. S53]MBK0139305.1 hypothetical protein [Enterococcus sp. S76]MBK0142940.1 hypothetical protein [Enterococcus sp. S77]